MCEITFPYSEKFKNKSPLNLGEEKKLLPVWFSGKFGMLTV